MDYHKILSDNWAIKLLSLALALTLWFYVTSTGKTEMTLTVPLELQNIRHGMTVVGSVAGSIEVRVQGQERVLRDSAIGKKVAGIIDLSMTKEGENTIRISPDDIKHPPGMTVTHMSLSEIKVRLEQVKRKTFKLHPILQGTPAAGYRLVDVAVIPPKITMEGPSSAVTGLRTVETMPVDIQGIKEDMTVEARIDYQGQPVKPVEKNIMIRIGIERIKK